KAEKDVGLGVRLPLYTSGPKSVGWWAMFITMLGDITAFVAIVFGYFFFWTIHEDFPPEGTVGPGVFWPVLAAGLLAAAWALTVAAGRANRLGSAAGFYTALTLAVLLAAGGSIALLAGPRLGGMDPTAHSYNAIVWLLVVWTVLH